MKEAIKTSNAPNPTGPYSQGVRTGNFVFVSGQDGVYPNGESAGSTVGAQTAACLENIKNIVSKAGGSLDSIVFVTCHLADLSEENVKEFNAAYTEYFSTVDVKPARITVGSQLLDGDVEITAIASI